MEQQNRNLRTEGAAAETIAEEFLIKKGFAIVEKNFHFGQKGEIDIIARDGACLVFVEVKSRRSLNFGTPESALTPQKVKTIRRTAEGYLYVNKITNQECRFDVVAIELWKKPPEIRHLVNAF